MRSVIISEAMAGLSQLVDAIESGQEDEVVIVRNGRPVARLVALSARQVGVRISVAKGEFSLPSTDVTSDTEVAALFVDRSGATPYGSQLVQAEVTGGRRPGRLAVRLNDSFFDELPPDELAAWEGPTK